MLHSGDTGIALLRGLPIRQGSPLDNSDVQRLIEESAYHFQRRLQVTGLLNMVCKVVFRLLHTENQRAVLDGDGTCVLQGFPVRAVVDAIFQPLHTVRPQGCKGCRCHSDIRRRTSSKRMVASLSSLIVLSRRVLVGVGLCCSSALKGRAQHDLLVVEPGSGERSIPTLEASASGGDERDVVRLNAFCIKRHPFGVQFAKAPQNPLLIPLLIASDHAVVKPRGLDGAAPRAEMLWLGGGSGELRIERNADMAPA